MARERATRILVVDDDRSICRELEECLVSGGYLTQVAHDGEDAVEKLGSMRYDVALVDLRMPGDIDGEALIDHIRENYPDIAIVIITGEAITKEEVARFFDRDVEDLLAKPINLRRLDKTIGRALARGKRRQRQRQRQQQ